jgi:L-ribulose-5-phosphate 3-epimerase
MAHGPGTPGGRVAVCSWSLRPQSAAELIESLSAAGLDAVSLALSPIVDQPQQWDGAIRALRSAGINIVSGMMAMRGEDYSTLESIARTGGVRPNGTWQANLSHANSVAKLAAEEGISLITFHAGFLPEQPDDPERETIIRRIVQLADLFADRDIALALETGQETAATLDHLLKELGRPNLGVNFDPANMILYGKGEPVAALRQLLPQVRQIHIKDAVASESPGQWGREVPVGQGQVRWQSFFEVLSGTIGGVDLVIEREAGESRIDDVCTAMRLLRSFGCD